jgi:hypothetical protein
MVRSQIVKANGERVKVDYMMRRNGDSWLISDIYLDGAISEVATRRSEFAAILKSQGIDGLIAALNRHPDCDYGKGIVARSPRTSASCNAGAPSASVTTWSSPRSARSRDPLSLILPRGQWRPSTKQRFPPTGLSVCEQVRQAAQRLIARDLDAPMEENARA